MSSHGTCTSPAQPTEQRARTNPKVSRQSDHGTAARIEQTAGRGPGAQTLTTGCNRQREGYATRTLRGFSPVQTRLKIGDDLE